MALDIGLIFGGKYRLVEPIAAGGMGSVWRARHLDLDIDVALKRMSDELAGSEVARRRFQREARAAAALKSPHVVQIHDYGVDKERGYIVMELLSGEDLQSRMTKIERASLAETAGVILPVCKALQIAHEAGVVHRDIKPSNIFLAAVGDEEIVKVLDFGIAKEVAVSAPLETSGSAVLGSPLYMSPEQARAGRLDHRTDLWSVAVIAYELCTGHHPFRGASLGDVFARICSETPSPPSEHGLLHPGLDAFFERALARDAERRFASARELGAAFAALVDDAPAAHPSLRSSGVAPETPAPRRGRETDTLALAATSPPGAPARGATSRRALVAIVLALGAGAAVATGFRASSAPPPPAPSQAAASLDAEVRPTTATATAAPPPAASFTAASSTAASSTAASSAASSTPAPVEAPRARLRPPPPAAAGSLRPEGSSAVPAKTHVDPIFGVQVSKP